MNCDPKSLLYTARCFRCLPKPELNASLIYSLCQWANASGVDCSQCSWLVYPNTALRNDTTGSIGFRFKVSQPISVCRLGRLYVAQNVQNHRIMLWQGPTPGTLLADGTVLAASASDANSFKWVDIEPVVLSPNTYYYVASNETNGGDRWRDAWNVTTLPNINTTVFPEVQAAYALVQSTFPGTLSGAVNSVFNTIGLWYGTV